MSAHTLSHCHCLLLATRSRGGAVATAPQIQGTKPSGNHRHLGTFSLEEKTSMCAKIDRWPTRIMGVVKQGGINVRHIIITKVKACL